MSKEVQAGFSYHLDRDCQFVLAIEIILITGKEHMLATEIFDSLQLLKKVGLHHRLVTKLVNYGALKPSQTDAAM